MVWSYFDQQKIKSFAKRRSLKSVVTLPRKGTKEAERKTFNKVKKDLQVTAEALELTHISVHESTAQKTLKRQNTVEEAAARRKTH